MSEITGASGQSLGAIVMDGVRKGYGEDWSWQQVIESVSLDLPPGQFTAVVGPSGCGKTTLVNLLAGFERADEGRIVVDGRTVSGTSRDRMVVFQESALMPWLTTYQNVAFGPKLRGDMRGGELDREIDRLLDKVGLSDFKDKFPLQLSGGMQRRAELARAMINSPSIMIMDEPFRGLDAMTRELMQEFLLQLFEETGRTHFFVTSEIEEAIFLADRLVVLSNRPVTVREVIDIELPRPREFHMLSTPEAYEYKRESLEILHEEAMKNFGGGGSGQSELVEAIARRG